jgi:hypothetical protein
MAYDRLALLTARAFAESPSVSIKVHLSESLPPASFASSSLGMPRIFDLLVPSVFFRSFFSLKSAQERRFSTIPELATAIVRSEH